jgi:hypothetical protein
MRIVAIRTAHQTFWNTVMRGQGELALYRCMTSEAEIRLCPAEKCLIQPPPFLTANRRIRGLTRLHQVRGVTRLAGHADELMLGSIVMLSRSSSTVTGKASRGILRRRAVESKDRSPSGFEIRVGSRRLHRVDMRFSGTVAPFAASHRLMMRLLDSRRLDNMTVRARQTLRRDWRFGRCTQNRRQDQSQRNDEY